MMCDGACTCVLIDALYLYSHAVLPCMYLRSWRYNHVHVVGSTCSNTTCDCVTGVGNSCAAAAS